MDEPPRMGHRVRDRLAELQMTQVDLLDLVPEISAGALSALIQRNGITFQWSDQVAEALGVNHRWLQTGTGPKERSELWPFSVTREIFDRISPERRALIDGFMADQAIIEGLIPPPGKGTALKKSSPSQRSAGYRQQA